MNNESIIKALQEQSNSQVESFKEEGIFSCSYETVEVGDLFANINFDNDVLSKSFFKLFKYGDKLYLVECNSRGNCEGFGFGIEDYTPLNNYDLNELYEHIKTLIHCKILD